MAAYKDFDYRNRIARRYGMFLTINEKGFWRPHLRNRFDVGFEQKSGFDLILERLETNGRMK